MGNMFLYVFGKLLTKVVFFGIVDRRLESIRVKDEQTTKIQKEDYNAQIYQEH